MWTEGELNLLKEYARFTFPTPKSGGNVARAIREAAMEAAELCVMQELREGDALHREPLARTFELLSTLNRCRKERGEEPLSWLKDCDTSHPSADVRLTKLLNNPIVSEDELVIEVGGTILKENDGEWVRESQEAMFSDWFSRIRLPETTLEGLTIARDNLNHVGAILLELRNEERRGSDQSEVAHQIGWMLSKNLAGLMMQLRADSRGTNPGTRGESEPDSTKEIWAWTDDHLLVSRDVEWAIEPR
jgi:hypothetical protein